MKKVNLFIVMMLFMTSGILAQEETQPEKYENVSWHEVVFVDYKPGKVKRAKEIIEKYKAAGQTAQLPGPEMHWLITGEYDLMLIWTMEGGPSDLEWRRSPNGVKWWKELVKQEGSTEKAEALEEEYTSLVAKSTSYLTRKEH